MRWEPAEPSQPGSLPGTASAGERLAASQQLLQNLRQLPSAASMTTLVGTNGEDAHEGVFPSHRR